eukprot:scpid47832/ scgid23051/ Di-N-acetylchitobiase
MMAMQLLAFVVCSMWLNQNIIVATAVAVDDVQPCSELWTRNSQIMPGSARNRLRTIHSTENSGANLEALILRRTQYQCNCSRFNESMNLGQGANGNDLCRPVNVSSSRPEVLVWYVPGDGDTWQHYDWTKVTTVAVLDDIHNRVSQDLVCFAHAHSVRVVYVIQYGCWEADCPWLQNSTARQSLVSALVAKVEAEKLDGVNVDIEGLNAYQSQFTELIHSLAAGIRGVCPVCQLSLDMPYIPMPVYSFTGYNWSALAEAADFLITMNYDMNDYGKSGFADANSPLWATKQAMNCILQPTFNQHVPANKIVMGFPWYAYYFRCDNSTPAGMAEAVKNPCYSSKPFSESASQHSLADAILNRLPHSSTGRLWDSNSECPYFDFMNGTARHRVWYDDKQSISVKCEYAGSLSVRGVAFWTANVDYGVPMPLSHEQLEATMWNSISWPR